MTLVTLHFTIHQPSLLRPYEQRELQGPLAADQLFDRYFDSERDRAAFCQNAERCYYPATRRLIALLEREGRSERPFKVAFGLSGLFIEQARRYEPGMIALLQELAATGLVEFTGQPYYHSLASLFEGQRQEFKEQASLQAGAIEQMFGQRPTVFHSTGGLYNNTVGDVVLQMGYDGVITEGVDWLMEGWRSPDFVYEAVSGLPVLLRNYGLSEDISLRFADRKWQSWPLRAETYAGWLAQSPGTNVVLGMDYLVLGATIPAEAGIFEFLDALPAAARQHPQLEFATPTEVVSRLPRQGKILVNDFATISEAPGARDTSLWLGNAMQQFVFEEMKRMEIDVRAAHSPELLRLWRLLQASDHLQGLADRKLGQGRVAEHFNTYSRICREFIALQTALADILRMASVQTDVKPAVAEPENRNPYPPSV